MPGKVKVKIVSGRNLPVMDRSNLTTDAYVEVKLGSGTFKTDVYRKSLNPVWNSEWFRFEMDDLELQDEPLQIRLMDHDTYSSNDAIGKVYLDLNPLLCNSSRGKDSSGKMISGWIPVYDTMHGIRGEVNLIVKVELFSDLNKFRQSSCGVRFFFTQSIPEGYIAHTMQGFVEELVVNDDPEYQWIDKIRTPRASNEARQTLFSKLSGELQRKVGLKALELGGNAVIGYKQCFDLEGESGIVVRGIGTAAYLTKQCESQLSPTCTDSLAINREFLERHSNYRSLSKTGNNSVRKRGGHGRAPRLHRRSFRVTTSPDPDTVLSPQKQHLDRRLRVTDDHATANLSSLTASPTRYRSSCPTSDTSDTQGQLEGEPENGSHMVSDTCVPSRPAMSEPSIYVDSTEWKPGERMIPSSNARSNSVTSRSSPQGASSLGIQVLRSTCSNCRNISPRSRRGCGLGPGGDGHVHATDSSTIAERRESLAELEWGVNQDGGRLLVEERAGTEPIVRSAPFTSCMSVRSWGGSGAPDSLANLQPSDTESRARTRSGPTSGVSLCDVPPALDVEEDSTSDTSIRHLSCLGGAARGGARCDTESDTSKDYAKMWSGNDCCSVDNDELSERDGFLLLRKKRGSRRKDRYSKSSLVKRASASFCDKNYLSGGTEKLREVARFFKRKKSSDDNDSCSSSTKTASASCRKFGMSKSSPYREAKFFFRRRRTTSNNARPLPPNMLLGNSGRSKSSSQLFRSNSESHSLGQTSLDSMPSVGSEPFFEPEDEDSSHELVCVDDSGQGKSLPPTLPTQLAQKMEDGRSMTVSEPAEDVPISLVTAMGPTRASGDGKLLPVEPSKLAELVRQLGYSTHSPIKLYVSSMDALLVYEPPASLLACCCASSAVVAGCSASACRPPCRLECGTPCCKCGDAPPEHNAPRDPCMPGAGAAKSSLMSRLFHSDSPSTMSSLSSTLGTVSSVGSCANEREQWGRRPLAELNSLGLSTGRSFVLDGDPPVGAISCGAQCGHGSEPLARGDRLIYMAEKGAEDGDDEEDEILVVTSIPPESSVQSVMELLQRAKAPSCTSLVIESERFAVPGSRSPIPEESHTDRASPSPGSCLSGACSAPRTHPHPLLPASVAQSDALPTTKYPTSTPFSSTNNGQGDVQPSFASPPFPTIGARGGKSVALPAKELTLSTVPIADTGTAGNCVVGSPSFPSLPLLESRANFQQQPPHPHHSSNRPNHRPVQEEHTFSHISDGLRDKEPAPAIPFSGDTRPRGCERNNGEQVGMGMKMFAKLHSACSVSSSVCGYKSQCPAVHQRHSSVTSTGMTGTSGSTSIVTCPSTASSSLHRRSSESDLSTPPKPSGMSSAMRNLTSAGGLKPGITAVDQYGMMEYPFITISQFPPGFLTHIGGTVTARSVKLLERISNLEEPESRDAWWNEIRMEIRAHCRAFGCTVVVGYEEHTTMCDDVCVLSASGTAAIAITTIGLKNVELLTVSTKQGGSHQVLTDAPCPGRGVDKERSLLAKLDSIALSSAPNGRGEDVLVAPKDGPESHYRHPCSIVHIVPTSSGLAFPVKMSRCHVCRKGRVPDVLLLTVDKPPGLEVTGKGTLIQSHVFRPKKDCKGEVSAKEVSDSLPFLEYELHRRLINKLKVKGMNAIFGLKVQICLGDKLMVAVATGTAMYVAALPPPGVPIITAGNLKTDAQKVLQYQKVIQEAYDKNRQNYQLNGAPHFGNPPHSASSEGEQSEEEDGSQLSSGNKDTYMLEVDDAEDIDIISMLIDPHPATGFLMSNIDYLHGYEETHVASQQMFTQVWRCRIPTLSLRQFTSYFERLIRSVSFKLRKMMPCVLSKLSFRVELPEPDEMQISIIGLALGMVDISKSVALGKHNGKSCAHSLSKDENELVFPIEDEGGGSLSNSGHGEASGESGGGSGARQTPPPGGVCAAPSGGAAASNSNSLLVGSRPSCGPAGASAGPFSSTGMNGSGLQVSSGGCSNGLKMMVELTPLPYIPGTRIDKYLGNLNFFFIRETTSIRENGGLSGFVHNFVTEVLAIVRAHVAALGGNAMVSYFMTELALLHNPHKNQGQCLVNVGGDVVLIAQMSSGALEDIQFCS